MLPLFIQITKERESGRKAEGPKHGKIDPKNAPHHGGNTWAGGTGGSNTAGMQYYDTFNFLMVNIVEQKECRY